MTQIDNTLAERGTRYGAFTGHAEITQGLKDVMFATDNWAGLADDQKEALEMVAHKIGRILNGDPNYIDSWHDIIGYTRLVEQRLEAEQTKQNPEHPVCPDCGERHDPGLGQSISANQKQLEELEELMAGMPEGIYVMFLDEESGEL